MMPISTSWMASISDLSKNEIDENTFFNLYEPMYFTTSNNRLIKNKTNPYVENRIEQILNHGLSAEDLPTVIVWKLGKIDQRLSFNRIVFIDQCNETLYFKTQYNTIHAKSLIDFISSNLFELQSLSRTDETELFLQLCENTVDYFGSTYIFTLMFFLSNGELPIYDKYAHKALLAINEDILPSEVAFKEIESSVKTVEQRMKAWKTYDEYRSMLKAVFGDKFAARKVDRSLWVYGHLFR